MTAHAISRALPRASARFTVGASVIGLIVGVGAAGLTVLVSSRATLLSGAAVLLVVTGCLWFATTSRTPLALALLMIYLGALDGYVKLSTGSNLATFVRDAFLYAIVAGLLARAAVQGKRLSAPPLSTWVVAFVVLVLAQIANPQGGSLYHSLAGLRQDLEFVPLFFLTFTFVRTKEALRTFVILFVLLAAANGLVNFVQFHLTPGQLAGWGPGYSQRILGTGGFQFAGRTFYTASGQNLTRPFGLMSDAGNGGLLCALALGGILALGSMPARRLYLPLAVLSAIAAVVGIVTSEGRAVIVASVIVVLAYALLTVTSRRAVATVLAVAAVATVSYVAVEIVSTSSPAVFRYQGVTTTQILQTTENARGKSIDQIPKNFVNYPLGAGLGVAGPASGTSGAPAAAGNVDAETEPSFVILEAGIPGMLILIGFTVALFVLGLRRGRREADPTTRVLLAAIVAPLAAMLGLYAVSAPTPTTPCGPYLWAAGGIVSYWLVARPAMLRRQSADVAGG